MNFRTAGISGLVLGLLLGVAPLRARATSFSGRIVGVVVDPRGVPQMGATVVVTAEKLVTANSIQLLTNARGRFVAAGLRPGIYSVRATLAGFLPTIDPHVQVSGRRTTSLQIELGSVFSGLASMRLEPGERAPDDEWSWVLRTSSATRPVLRWDEGDVLLDNRESSSDPERRHARSQIELTSGSRHPGSISNLADSPATAFAYDQGIGPTGQLLFAGQFSYESATPAGGFATVWMPEGNGKSGPVTSLVMRESRLGPQGPFFRGLRLDQDGAIPLSDRVTFRYGAEFLMASLGQTTTGVRPRAELAVELARGWQASLLLASRPLPETSPEAASSLNSALDSLDTLPTLLFRNGHPVLESGWHEELAVEHFVGKNGRVMAAAFHDLSTNAAIFGKGPANGPDFLQDFFSDGFAYDAGSSGSWGTRLAYQQKFSDRLNATAVYAWAGALAPGAHSSTAPDLRDALETRYRHSLAGSISSRLPRIGTEVTTGYKWISGTVVSRQDEFGEAFFQIDPYWNLVVRQPLPCIFSHHMEAMADFGNLLAQGYVPITTRDGRVVLVSAYRTFRGGISLQF